MKRGRLELGGTEQGSSLVEALVAMSILSIVLTGCVGFFAIADDGLATGAKSLLMTALAESRIEALRTIPYPALMAPVFTGDSEALTVVAAAGGQFLGRQTIQGILMTYTVTPDNPVLIRSRAATITVAADWADPRGRHRLVRFGLRRANPVYSGVRP
jgi:pilin/secretion family protein with methylation motif